MTDESGIDSPAHIEALLDGALGPQGYYGVFTANMHTDDADARRAPTRSSPRRRRAACRRLGRADARLARRPQRLVVHGPGLRRRAADVQRGAAAPARAASRRCCRPRRTGGLTALTRDGAASRPRRAVKGITTRSSPAAAGAYVATTSPAAARPAGTTPPPTPDPDRPTRGTPGPGTPGGYGQSTQPPAAGSGVAGRRRVAISRRRREPKVMKHTVRVTRQGVLRLQVRCPRSEVRCRVDVRLRHGGRRVAKAAATLPGGKTRQGQGYRHRRTPRAPASST